MELTFFSRSHFDATPRPVPITNSTVDYDNLPLVPWASALDAVCALIRYLALRLLLATPLRPTVLCYFIDCGRLLLYVFFGYGHVVNPGVDLMRAKALMIVCFVCRELLGDSNLPYIFMYLSTLAQCRNAGDSRTRYQKCPRCCAWLF